MWLITCCAETKSETKDREPFPFCVATTSNTALLSVKVHENNKSLTKLFFSEVGMWNSEKLNSFCKNKFKKRSKPESEDVFDAMANGQGRLIHTFNVTHLFLQLDLQLDGGRQKDRRWIKDSVQTDQWVTEWNDDRVKHLRTKEDHNTRTVGGWVPLSGTFSKHQSLICFTAKLSDTSAVTSLFLDCGGLNDHSSLWH